MKIKLEKHLNVFIDETGEFGFSKSSAKFYGVSLVFHEQDKDIKTEIDQLNSRLNALNFCSMVHMGDLVCGHADFADKDISERKKIFTQLYRFATKIDAKYHSFFISKHDSNTTDSLKKAIERELQTFVLDHLAYLQSFDKIRVYYDGGQRQLSKIIDKVFGSLGGYERKNEFDHTEKKLFQVADMLTYVDKVIFKYSHHVKISKTEAVFFNYKTADKIKRELKQHRFQQK